MLVDRLVPNKAKAKEIKDKIDEMVATGQFNSLMAQLEINKAETAHRSIFVAGWRPFIGWVCGMSLAYQYLLRPILMFVSKAFHFDIPDFPGIDDNLWELMIGMLGLGTLRTFEKIKNVSK